ncbi:MAG TPA: hypothetical protein VF841_07145 [Anaeromyxobacter sp.]
MAPVSAPDPSLPPRVRNVLNGGRPLTRDDVTSLSRRELAQARAALLADIEKTRREAGPAWLIRIDWLGSRIAAVEQEVRERNTSLVLWATLVVGALAVVAGALAAYFAWKAIPP